MAASPIRMVELTYNLEKCLSKIAPGIQEARMKYITFSELALFFNKGGNAHFKEKNYRDAVEAYSVGLAVCGNVDIHSALFNNRSAAHYFLMNYSSSLEDCLFALMLKPDHKKCFIRAANCCYELEKIQECLVYCNKILEMEPKHKEIMELRQNCFEANDAVKKERPIMANDPKYGESSENEDEMINKCLERLPLDYQELCFNNEMPRNLHQREVLALIYKYVGNIFFKARKYENAASAYSNGIERMSRNVHMDTTLYNNRSAANYFLKNYSLSLYDCEFALVFKPEYKKCLIRAANCHYKLKQIQTCLLYCEKILETESDREEILELRRKCIEANGAVKKEVKKEKTRDDLVLEEISKRNIKIHGVNGPLRMKDLETSLPAYFEQRVHIDGINNLLWPVIFLHEEMKRWDFIPNFSEGRTIASYISEKIPLARRHGMYRLETLNVYCYYQLPRSQVFKVDVQSTLLNILQKEGFVLKGGIPLFHVVLRNSTSDVSFVPFIKF